MVEEKFQQQRRYRGFEKDSQSAFYQQQELFKQLEQSETKKRSSLKQIEEWPNTQLSEIKGDIPRHQTNKRSSTQPGARYPSIKSLCLKKV